MTQIHFGKHHNEPLWRPRRLCYGTSIPEHLSAWLFDSGSLTQRLIESCPGPFSIRVLSQGWGRPLLNEAQRLGMRRAHYALIRQVHLCCDGIPWVFARTIIPARTLTGSHRRLAHLGSKSLGAVLFANHNLQRSEMELACIAKGQQIYTLATEHLPGEARNLWGRRSLFTLRKRALLVSEIFLPQTGPYRAKTGAQ